MLQIDKSVYFYEQTKKSNVKQRLIVDDDGDSRYDKPVYSYLRFFIVAVETPFAARIKQKFRLKKINCFSSEQLKNVFCIID